MSVDPLDLEALGGWQRPKLSSAELRYLRQRTLDLDQALFRVRGGGRAVRVCVCVGGRWVGGVLCVGEEGSVEDGPGVVQGDRGQGWWVDWDV
jgi:hypothetical protein